MTFTLLSIVLQTQTALPRTLLIQTDLSSKAQGSLCCLIRLRLVRHPRRLQRASALLQMPVHHIGHVNVVTIDAGLVSIVVVPVWHCSEDSEPFINVADFASKCLTQQSA